MASYFKLFLELQKSNLKTAFTSKVDAILNILFMLANNLAFAFMWWVLLKNKGSVNGWGIEEVFLMSAFTNFGYAIYAVLFRGVERIPEYIESGALDSYIASPRNPIFMISMSESTFANWGDFITAGILLFASGYTSFDNITMFLVVGILTFITTFSFRLILSSLSFYRDGIDRLSNNLFLSFLIFSSQPGSVFRGWYKVIYLTIIPAGFISLFPVEIIRNFSISSFGILLIFNAFIFTLAIYSFNKGLKKYGSGNRFGVR